MSVRARILLLTEDSGRQAQATVEKLLKEAFKFLVPGVDLNPKRIRVEPLPENDRARQGVRANNWKTDPPTRDTIVLFGAIAAQLLQPGGFVVFHFDADRVWTERHTSENRQKFDSIIRERVRSMLRGSTPSPFNPVARRMLTPEQVEAALARLLVLSPCYSIESWLYQSTHVLLARCQEKHVSEEHVRRIESWSANRQLLDDTAQPKSALLPCIGDRYNEDLAKAFSAEDVWLAERSFHESVEQLRTCPSLVEALEH